jgi:hypothetical protein
MGETELREALRDVASRFWPLGDGGYDYSDDPLYVRVEALLLASVPTEPERASKEGYVDFHVAIRVGTAEFSTWRPERISAFFGGIAQVLAAKGRMDL